MSKKWMIAIGLALGLFLAAVYTIAVAGDRFDADVVDPDVPISREDAQNLANPYEENSEFLSSGKRIYQRVCINCHGSDGELPGFNPLAKSIPDRTDGDLVWVTTYGLNPESRMRPFVTRLSNEERWQVVRYLRSEF